jgi:hemerythrin-like metal-binding protein
VTQFLTEINNFAIRNSISYYEFTLLDKEIMRRVSQSRHFNFWKDFRMLTLQWTDSLMLDLPQMDDTHKEFVALLDKVVNAPDETLLPLWRALITHTDAHFAREDSWMKNTGFASSNCHSTQHLVVLQVMREGEKRADLGIVRQMADELGMWFPQHAQAMDAALALHLRSVGFDTTTGQIKLPDALPARAIQGCGGATCSPQEEPLKEVSCA